MMTTKESQRMARLEAENRELRAMCDKHIDVYRDQAIELIELRAKLQLIVGAVMGEA